MRSKYSFRPRIETLEERAVPATIKLVAGQLFISNPTAALTVTSLGAGQVKVQDGLSSPVTLSGVGNIFITGTNKADVITVDAPVATPFAGNVLINAGNGNDAIYLLGKIGGNLTVLGGLGNDFLTNGTFGAPAPLTVLGNLTYVDSSGSNDINIGDDLTVGGNLTLTGVNDVTLQIGKILTVGGNLSASAVLSGAKLNFVTLTTSQFIVGKNVTLTGYGADDFTVLLGEVQVGGNTSINFGQGDNTAQILPDVTSSINGNVSFSGGAGNDFVQFDADLTIGGNVNLNLGEGNNTLITAPVTVNGNFNVTAANGNNILNFTNAVLLGNVNLLLGNGNNTTTFTTAPAGVLKLVAGNGDNILNITPAATTAYVVDLLFGNGDNTVTLNANTIISGKLIGGTGSNTFNQNLATILSPWLQVNFP